MFNWGGGGGGGMKTSAQSDLEVYKLFLQFIDTTFAVGFLFTTAKVVSITAMIFFLSNSYFCSSLNI